MLKFPEDYFNKIICGDCLGVMKTMPDESVDLVVTSPPYNMGESKKLSNGGLWKNPALREGYTVHKDNMPHEEYVAWQVNCLNEMYRLIKADGAIFYNHKWRIQKGLLQNREDIVSHFPVRQIIIWKRAGGMNFNTSFFLPSYEVVYLITKPAFKLADGANACGDVWEFRQESNNAHPAPFPVSLIKRIISSTDALIVLDPFMGSGTTAVAAKELERIYIGVDNSPDYCAMAEKRVAWESRQQSLVGVG